MNPCDPYKALLMGLIDHELTPEETQEINHHLIRCPQCREEFEELRETSGKLDIVSLAEPEDEVLEQFWKSPFTRFTRNAGIVLVLAGYAALILMGIIEFLKSGTEGLSAKLALSAIVIGFLILLVNAIRERVKSYKVDPYKHIKR